MHQGVIAIGGQAGDMIGFNMTGGAVLVVGDAGIRPGAGMQGGTIALLGPTPPAVLPSFQFDREARSEKLSAILRDMCEKGLRVDESLLAADMNVYVGDLVAEGSGEIHLRHIAAG